MLRTLPLSLSLCLSHVPWLLGVVLGPVLLSWMGVVFRPTSGHLEFISMSIKTGTATIRTIDRRVVYVGNHQNYRSRSGIRCRVQLLLSPSPFPPLLLLHPPPFSSQGERQRQRQEWRKGKRQRRKASNASCAEGLDTPRGCAPVKDGLLTWSRTRPKDKAPMKTNARSKKTTRHSNWDTLAASLV